MIPLETIEQAREAVAKHAIRTPLVPLNLPESGRSIHLKLENLQPIHSFKIRGALALFASLDDEKLEEGVVTASAGNFAQEDI